MHKDSLVELPQDVVLLRTAVLLFWFISENLFKRCSYQSNWD